MATIINLNNTTPPAPAGFQNTIWQADGTQPIDNVSAYIPNIGGVNIQTGPWTIGTSDNGRLIAFNSSTSVAVTLSLAVALPTKFTCQVVNIGTGSITVTPDTSSTINTGTAVVLTTGEGIALFLGSDGNFYFNEFGASGTSSPLTTKGDLYTYDTANARLAVGTDGQILTADSTQTKGVKWAAAPVSGISALTGDVTTTGSGSVIATVAGIAGVPIDSTSLPDGVILQKNNTTGKWEPVFVPVRLASAVPGKPVAGQEVLIFVVDLPIVFPANFTGATAGFGPNGAHPTVSATYVVYRNTTQIGTVVVSTAGAFTFATTSGLQQTANTGDVVSIIAPGTQDATMASVTMTFMAFRGASIPAFSGSVPIITWMGAYSGSVAYAIYNVVSYSGNSYICILQTTMGTLPTNTTYWQVMAAAGAAGGVQVAQDIAGTTSAPIVAGLRGKSLDATTVGSPTDGQIIQYESSSGLYKAKTITTGAILKTNGTTNGSQSLLNLTAGTAFSITDDGSGNITFSDMNVPLLSTFTWANQGTATAVQAIANGPILLNVPDNSSINWRLLTAAQPSTPYKVITQMRMFIPGTYTNSVTAGIYFYDGTKIMGMEFLSQNTAGGCGPRIEKMNTVTSDNSTAKSTTLWSANPVVSSIWMQLRNSGTTLYFDFSFDGVNFTNYYSEAVGTFITPIRIGFGAISITNVSTNYVLNNILNWRTVGNATL